MKSKAKEFVLTFTRKEKLADNIYTFYFLKNEDFDFLPGQYVRVTLPHEDSDNRGMHRYFTICSSPLEKYLTISTKLVKSTFKKKIFALRKGDEVTFFGPMGNLVLDERESASLVFLAGGMGITPFRSMVKYVSDKDFKTQITLIVSQKENARIFQKELEETAAKHKNIRVFFTDKKIDKKLIAQNISNLNNQKFFVVGPPMMVEDTKKVLQEMGVSGDKIFFEDFTGY